MIHIDYLVECAGFAVDVRGLLRIFGPGKVRNVRMPTGSLTSRHLFRLTIAQYKYINRAFRISVI